MDVDRPQAGLGGGVGGGEVGKGRGSSAVEIFPRQFGSCHINSD